MSWLNIGQILNVNAVKYPDKLAMKDKKNQLTFKELNQRTNQLANGFLKIGLKKGDKISILSNNSIKLMEIYIAAAKIGLIIIPLNVRLHINDLVYIIKNSDSQLLIVESQLYNIAKEVSERIIKIGFNILHKLLISDDSTEGWQNYENILKQGKDTYPLININPEDTWFILYTSGTTGKPKGVIRSHQSFTAFFLINAVEFSFTTQDYGLFFMPFSHINSIFHSFIFTYIGAPIYIHFERSFEPEEILKIIYTEKITFTSMIPYHYNLILALPEEIKNKYDLNSVRALLTSSAPASKQMKLNIMKLFNKAQLFEAYGSTEAGLITLLKPEDQINKIGSVGKECIGSEKIQILDVKGNYVPEGEMGELYSYSPQMFDGYYKLPEITKNKFRGNFFSSGDIGKRDRDGFYYLIDRKYNMIITGGEHVFPSEVEKIICLHPSINVCAVIGLQDNKWGEKIIAICEFNKHVKFFNNLKNEILELCRNKLARFKIPKNIYFIKSEEFPRTSSGKINYRVLREQFKRRLNKI